jgi:hypothetical protein
VVSSVNGQLPELTQGFFTNTDRYTFAVNSELLAGTQQLKKNSAANVVTALNSNDRNFIAVGLNLTNVSYKGLMSGIIGAPAPTPRSQRQRQAERRHPGDDRAALSAETGVNLDEELANRSCCRTPMPPRPAYDRDPDPVRHAAAAVAVRTTIMPVNGY